MEPSWGRWARSLDDGRAKVEAGFRNFVSHIDTIILHFCIRHYLCVGNERYHITDLSKGAMPIKRASIARSDRYERWYGLLLEEVDLVATSEARIFAVGQAVARHLGRACVSEALHHGDPLFGTSGSRTSHRYRRA